MIYHVISFLTPIEVFRSQKIQSEILQQPDHPVWVPGKGRLMLRTLEWILNSAFWISHPGLASPHRGRLACPDHQ